MLRHRMFLVGLGWGGVGMLTFLALAKGQQSWPLSPFQVSRGSIGNAETLGQTRTWNSSGSHALLSLEAHGTHWLVSCGLWNFERRQFLAAPVNKNQGVPEEFLPWGRCWETIATSCFQDSLFMFFQTVKKKIAKKYMKNPLINNERKAISYCKFPCKMHSKGAARAHNHPKRCWALVLGGSGKYPTCYGRC